LVVASPLKAIFFDVGNTLLFPNQSIILAPLHQRGIIPTMEQWHAIERKTKHEFDGMLERDGHADHGFWYLFYEYLLEELDVRDHAIHRSLVESTRVSANWSNLRPGTRDILDRLRLRHRLAVISNADGKIEPLLQRNGIADCFESITDSGMVGCEKPAPRIFHQALAAMRVDAAASLYVGDVYSVDYLGATRAGMQAVLFDVAGAYQAKGAERVGSLEELETMLQRQPS
jgi:putative hydrolase of the HAD superfamily